MIKLVRVDHRLLHGQVAFSWTNGVGANCILVASDTVVNATESNTTTQISKQVFLEDEAKAILKELMNRGVECEIRALVDDSKINVAHALK